MIKPFLEYNIIDSEPFYKIIHEYLYIEDGRTIDGKTKKECQLMILSGESGRDVIGFMEHVHILAEKHLGITSTEALAYLLEDQDYKTVFTETEKLVSKTYDMSEIVQEYFKNLIIFANKKISMKENILRV